MSAVENTTPQVQPLPQPVIIPGTGARVDPTQEYVASSQRMTVWDRILENLSWAIDDISRDFGDDVYERMILDPVVMATITILMASILEEGIRTAPAVTDPADPDAALADTINKRAVKMLANLPTRLSSVAWDMLRGCYLGNRVAETIWKYVEEDGRLYLDIVAIKARPRRNLAFVVDVYGNLHGFTVSTPDRTKIATPGAVIEKSSKDILPRDKFWVYSFRPVEGDPRGISILRPAFSSWVDKIQTLAERQKHLARFGSPTLIGMTPENAKDVPVLDAVTGQPTGDTVNALHALYMGLLHIHNGTVMATVAGTKIDVVQSTGGGEAFTAALSYGDRAIVKTILTQTLATEDAPHQARAAAQVHQGTLDTIVKQAKQDYAGSFRDDVLKVWVARNWGEQYAYLAPTVSLGVTEAPNLPAMMSAVAALFVAGYFSKSQIAELDELLNLSPRLPSELEELQVKPPAPAPPPKAPAAPANPAGNPSKTPSKPAGGN